MCLCRRINCYLGDLFPFFVLLKCRLWGTWNAITSLTTEYAGFIELINSSERSTIYIFCHMATHIWINVGSGSGLLPTATSHYPNQYWFIRKGVHLKTIAQWLLMNLTHNIYLYITLIQLLPSSPGFWQNGIHQKYISLLSAIIKRIKVFLYTEDCRFYSAINSDQR